MQCAGLGATALLGLKYKSAPKTALQRKEADDTELYTGSRHQPRQASETNSSSKQDTSKQEAAGMGMSTVLYIEINEYIFSACKLSFFFNKGLNCMYTKSHFKV